MNNRTEPQNQTSQEEAHVQNAFNNTFSNDEMRQNLNGLGAGGVDGDGPGPLENERLNNN